MHATFLILPTSGDGSHVYFLTKAALTDDDLDGTGNDIYERAGSTTRLGLTLLFDSPAPHTSDDTDAEADLFVWANGSLTRVSFGPDPGMGDGAFGAFVEDASQDLSRVYFETSEVLDSRDTDASRDVYAWRSAAVGFDDGAFPSRSLRPRLLSRWPWHRPVQDR